MKTYFIANRTDKSKQKIYDKVISEIEKLGHKVDRSWIESNLEEDAKNFEKAYNRTLKSLKNADIVIAETTDLSSGIGFLISSALNEKKPVLALYNTELGSLPSTTLRGTKNKLMTFKEYNKDAQLKEIIGSFFKDIKGIMDTKFILIIPAEIDRFLEWASEHRRMHKAQIVRGALEEVMAKDKEWKSLISIK